MKFQTYTLFAEVAPELTAQDTTNLFITAILSTTVIATIISSIIQYIISRRSSRVTERRNSVESESDIILRYKEAAAEERAQKESAVRTLEVLLKNSESQVQSLNSTIDILNGLIANLNKMAETQKEVIAQLTADRNKTQEALQVAITQLNTTKKDLEDQQKAITELTRPQTS